jgi:5-methyltetrahydropteroyltriglutamate--homocysteine methyltransferase
VYNDKKELAFAFAEALRQEAESIEPVVDMISIDEPFYANVFPEYAGDLLHHICDTVSCPTRLHACVDVSNIVSLLLDLPVDVLSHEFMATPSLFDQFADFSCEHKKFCLGSVRSDSDTLESVDELVNHINHGRDVFGDTIVQIAPDCGLRLLPQNTAFMKLSRLHEAIERIYYE